MAKATKVDNRPAIRFWTDANGVIRPICGPKEKAKDGDDKRGRGSRKG